VIDHRKEEQLARSANTLGDLFDNHPTKIIGHQ